MSAQPFQRRLDQLTKHILLILPKLQIERMPHLLRKHQFRLHSQLLQRFMRLHTEFVTHKHVRLAVQEVRWRKLGTKLDSCVDAVVVTVGDQRGDGGTGLDLLDVPCAARVGEIGLAGDEHRGGSERLWARKDLRSGVGGLFGDLGEDG